LKRNLNVEIELIDSERFTVTFHEGETGETETVECTFDGCIVAENAMMGNEIRSWAILMRDEAEAEEE